MLAAILTFTLCVCLILVCLSIWTAVVLYFIPASAVHAIIERMCNRPQVVVNVERPVKRRRTTFNSADTVEDIRPIPKRPMWREPKAQVIVEHWTPPVEQVQTPKLTMTAQKPAKSGLPAETAALSDQELVSLLKTLGAKAPPANPANTYRKRLEDAVYSAMYRPTKKVAA